MGRDAAAGPPTIVFDLDGTLVDTAEDLVATLNAVGARHRLAPISVAGGKTLVGGGARVMIERAFAAERRPLAPGELDGLLAEFLAHYREHLVDRSRAYPGAAAVLTRFAASGWRLAVCTNKTEAIARRLLALVGLADRFAAITGQDTFGYRKPDPRHLIETIRLAGGDPARALMVGDSETDVATAVAAQVPVIAVSFGYSARDVATLGANRVVDGFAELWDAVASLGVDARPAIATRRD